MKIVGILKELEGDNEQLKKYNDKAERDAAIQVAFKTLRDCDLMICGIQVDHQHHSLTHFTLEMETLTPFDYTLMYEPGNPFLTGHYATIGGPMAVSNDDFPK